MAAGQYYLRVLDRAWSETVRLCAPHWLWKVLAGAVGTFLVFAAMRGWRGEPVFPETGADPIIAASGGAVLVWVTTFLYKLILAPVELDAEQGMKIEGLTPPLLTPLQQEQLKTLGDIFDNCEEDALKILGKLVNGPLPVATVKKSQGAEDFNRRTGPAMQQGIFQSMPGANGLSYSYEIQGGWRQILERYVNDRLALSGRDVS